MSRCCRRALTPPANRARTIRNGRRSGRCARPRSSRIKPPTRSITRTRSSSSGAFPCSTCPISLRLTQPSTSRQAFWRRRSFPGGYLGYGISMPYFINLAPNYDLTLTPTFLSKQGLFGEVDWRQRLSNGTYNIKATGIDQEQPGLFPAFPYGAGDTRLRGSIESAGNFFLNDMWQLGWNGTWLSDKFFLNDYRLQGINFDNFYFQDIVSSVYLRGQAGQSFFDLSAYHFEGTTANDDNRTLPTAVAPSLRLQPGHQRSRRPHQRPRRRGECRHQRRQHQPDRSRVPIDWPADIRQRLSPLQRLRDAGRERPTVNTLLSRASACCAASPAITRAPPDKSSWQRRYIDPIGEDWKPFVFATSRRRGDGTQ